MTTRRNDEEFEKICHEEAVAGETVVVGREIQEPRSDLGKLLLALVQAVGGFEPQAFVKVNVENALRQADAIKAE